MLSSKLHDDMYLTNKSWAPILGLSLREVNVLEIRFVFLLNCDFYVSRAEYVRNVKTIMTTEQISRLESALASS